jgi:hypothetical protein
MFSKFDVNDDFEGAVIEAVAPPAVSVDIHVVPGPVVPGPAGGLLPWS